MDIPILYEDTEIVVIDKPSGVVCNRSETTKEPTLQDWMAEKLGLPIVSTTLQSREKFQSVEEIDYDAYFRSRYGLVHRLDKETSGVMVLGKTVASFTELLRQFRERETQKEYLALTHGIWQPKEGEIALPIARRRDDRKKFGVREDGKESVTVYTVVSEYKTWQFPKELKVDDRGYAGFSLVSFLPKTGRTHQIRVHAQQVGHPLVGDMDYAGRKRSREDRKWALRVMLQAEKLTFTHPFTKEKVSFVSKNLELQQVLQYFTGPVI